MWRATSFRRSLIGVPKVTPKSRGTPQRAKFQRAVEACPPPVSAAFEPGIQALRRGHRALILCPDASRLTGSIDLDRALAEQPNSPRWDYGLGFRYERQENAVWVEVHVAQTNKVRGMLNKLRWLKDWLQGEGKPFRGMTESNDVTPPFVWLASGPIRIPANSPQARLASQAGIRPRKRLFLTTESP